MFQKGFLCEDVSFRLHQLRKVGVLLDHKEQLILLHEISVLEVDPVQVPLYPRSELNRIYPLGIARDFMIFDDIFPHRLAHCHVWRRRPFVFGLLLARPKENHRQAAETQTGNSMHPRG